MSKPISKPASMPALLHESMPGSTGDPEPMPESMPGSVGDYELTPESIPGSMGDPELTPESMPGSAGDTESTPLSKSKSFSRFAGDLKPVTTSESTAISTMSSESAVLPEPLPETESEPVPEGPSIRRGRSHV